MSLIIDLLNEKTKRDNIFIDKVKKIFEPLKEVYYTKVKTKTEVKEKFLLFFSRSRYIIKSAEMPLRIQYNAYNNGTEDKIRVKIIFDFWAVSNLFDEEYISSCSSAAFSESDLKDNEYLLNSEGFKSLYEDILQRGQEYLIPKETLNDLIKKPEFRTLNIPEVTPDP